MANSIAISFNDDSADESVHAEYYLIDGGWITFKTAAHKVVAAYRESIVDRLIVAEK